MKSGNPAFFAGFPSEVEKSVVRLFHGAAFPQLLRRPFCFSYCAPPVVRIYGLSSVRYLVAMFRLSRNHSAPADGIMRSCWRSFCGIHLNDQVTHCMTSQTALWIYARPCSCAFAESQYGDAASGHRGGPGRITNTSKIRSSGGNGWREDSGGLIVCFGRKETRNPGSLDLPVQQPSWKCAETSPQEPEGSSHTGENGSFLNRR